MLPKPWFLILICLAAAVLGSISKQQIPLHEDVPHATVPDLLDASIVQLSKGLQAGEFTSLQLVQAYQARISEVNTYTHAVLELNPNASLDACASDSRRRSSLPLRPLEGIPILIKDNIAQAGETGINTTAGSFALLASPPTEDAFVVQRLKEAGAVILGRTNMCEWAHGRGPIPYGWSARGGQTLSPFYRSGNPCGSSSGSGVATSLGLAAATLGTETGGSITCPSHRNNVVGVKPTRGLTSRYNVVPLLLRRDTVGPITQTVQDGALVLQAIAGKDPRDSATDSQPPIPDYTANLHDDALDKARIGILRVSQYLNGSGANPHVLERLSWAAGLIGKLGADVVDPFSPSPESIGRWQVFQNSTESGIVSSHEMKFDIESYLESISRTLSGAPASLQDIIHFNSDHAMQELPTNYSDQNGFIRASLTDGKANTTYLAAVARLTQLLREDGLVHLMDQYSVDAVVAVLDDGVPIAYSAQEGLPVVTVPLGFHPNTTAPISAGSTTLYPAPGMPFGLMFIGRKWSEQRLLGYAYAFEQATKVRDEGRERIVREAKPKTNLVDIVSRGAGIRIWE